MRQEIANVTLARYNNSAKTWRRYAMEGKMKANTNRERVLAVIAEHGNDAANLIVILQDV